MKAEDETNNKLDMSLDEIIKLDKKEARKNRRVQQTLAIRGRRQNASQYRQKPRISAAATRLRGLRQKRLSRINRPIQGSSSQHQVLTKNKRVFTVKNIRSSRSTAQAVLRRAQRTAAAAARTAADATALLQRNRIQRQQLFNERRNIQPTSRIAYERRPSRRRSAPASTVGSRGAYTTPQVTGRSWQSEQQSLNFQRRPRRRSLQVDGHHSVEPYPEIIPYATTPLFVTKGGVNERISGVVVEVNSVMVIRLHQLVVQPHGLVMQNILLKLVPLSKHRMKTLSGMILTVQIRQCGTLEPIAHHTET
ncbi:unnamed protein product [Schistosoma margrebowiei]|uniref:Uncharacterized protein n=1 Tax=Schistosoma margrebowiei TaxID=48269 RepID=A0AA84ZJ58_9TREM|nr:unnamed protein product [Schistosoma margrebowiei]